MTKNRKLPTLSRRVKTLLWTLPIGVAVAAFLWWIPDVSYLLICERMPDAQVRALAGPADYYDMVGDAQPEEAHGLYYQTGLVVSVIVEVDTKTQRVRKKHLGYSDFFRRKVEDFFPFLHLTLN